MLGVLMFVAWVVAVDWLGEWVGCWARDFYVRHA